MVYICPSIFNQRSLMLILE
ncbi:hypothetical protein M8C21_018082 [Ambrosia artemisiifolia]|uniref:Uncharacterized protein n=1 Tax=Ambrosia artemisiifolia TaxID=4212 RepID=A0AAD5GU26_AMBAR|nr:hypothetical protein M8C21_018082 [Ambrosia artemisiifolia]